MFWPLHPSVLPLESELKKKKKKKIGLSFSGFNLTMYKQFCPLASMLKVVSLMTVKPKYYSNIIHIFRNFPLFCTFDPLLPRNRKRLLYLHHQAALCQLSFRIFHCFSIWKQGVESPPKRKI